MGDQLLRGPLVFRLDRLAEYTDEALLTELRRVSDSSPATALTTRWFNRHSRVSATTVTQRFGSWERALTAAGLSDRWLGSRAAKLVATKSITDDEILEALVDLANRLGKTELTWREVNAHLHFRGDTLKTRWGSVTAAFEAAGLSSTRRGHRYSDEECFDNMLATWTHYGRPPRFREMSALPSRVAAAPYAARFGSWKKALAAFVERVNSDLDVEISDAAKVSSLSIAEKLSTSIEDDCRDRRNISLGLRFAVLSRDRFKCIKCGDSPSVSISCILHVDHIVPWSKGGRTAIDNLRSLCDACNLGRGNRYDD